MKLPELCVVDDFLKEPEIESLFMFTDRNKVEFQENGQSNRKALVMTHFHDEEFFTKYANLIYLKAKELGYQDNQHIEIQLTCSRNGDYFKEHRDVGRNTGTRRKLSYVYYFFRDSSMWIGGDLRFDNITVKPKHNQLVFFSPYARHELTQLQCGNNWINNRFTLNGWFRNEGYDGTIKVG